MYEVYASIATVCTLLSLSVRFYRYRVYAKYYASIATSLDFLSLRRVYALTVTTNVPIGTCSSYPTLLRHSPADFSLSDKIHQKKSRHPNITSKRLQRRFRNEYDVSIKALCDNNKSSTRTVQFGTMIVALEDN